jgi:hypothetical protein
MKNFAAILFLCVPLIGFAQPKDKEEGCKQAIAAMLSEIRSSPANTPREKQDKEKILSKVESRVKEMRAARKTECEIWTEVGGILAGQ